MLISEAFAQTAAPAAEGLSGLTSMLPLLLIFVIFYFLLIRPQQKRAKEHKATLAQLRRGDKVVTGGGIIGQVVKVQDNEVTVEIAENGRIKVVQDTITSVVTRGEPVASKGANDGDAAKPAGEGKGGSSLGRLLSGKKD